MWLKQLQSHFHERIPHWKQQFLLLWCIPCTVTSKISRSSKNMNHMAHFFVSMTIMVKNEHSLWTIVLLIARFFNFCIVKLPKNAIYILLQNFLLNKIVDEFFGLPVKKQRRHHTALIRTLFTQALHSIKENIS